jgi:hypothetical protein
MLGDRAWVPVFALSPVQKKMVATVLAKARILGAVVQIVTELDQASPHEFGLIGGTVAVVVQAVAGFSGRSAGVTFG